MAKKLETLKQQADYLRAKAGFDLKSINPTDLESNYYNLIKRVVTQKINEFYRGYPNIMEVMPFEKGVNGLKEEFKISFMETEDFDPKASLTIDDFNGQDPAIKSDLFGIDKEKKLKFRLMVKDLIDFFTNDAKLVDFAQRIIARARQSFDLLLFRDMTATLLQTTNKVITFSPDKTINTSTMDAESVLAELRSYIVSVQMPSNTHITKPSDITAADGKKFVYSANPENLMVIYNSKFYTKDVANLKSTLFNKDDVAVNIDSKVLDFSLIEGAVKSETDKIKAYIIDKSAFSVGFEVQNLTQVLSMPNFQKLHEMLMFYGFARRGEYAIAVFKDVPTRKSKPKPNPNPTPTQDEDAVAGGSTGATEEQQTPP